MSEWKFKRDTAFRKQFFVSDSFAHPAKMDTQLLIRIVEKYTKPGEVILDPMAGSGTTMLACTLGRNCILVELEEKFCKMIEANWEQVKMRPQLGYQMGTCQIIQSDARQLEGLVDKIVTSPPFGEAQSGGGIAQKGYQGNKHGPTDLVGRRTYMPENVGDNPDQISNLPYGNIDSIITSPPYEEGKAFQDFNFMAKQADDYPDRLSQGLMKGHNRTAEAERKYLDKVASGQIEDSTNIGNLKSNSYLEAMLQVYQQCCKVLKPQGLMILVVKNFIRNKEEVDLRADTVKLCEQAGFHFKEEHHRILLAQSFWRIIYKQKYPDAPEINREYVLVFEREK